MLLQVIINKNETSVNLAKTTIKLDIDKKNEKEHG